MKIVFLNYWNTCRKYWQKGWTPAIFIIGMFIYLLNISWLKWGSPLIDTGRELYVPYNLLSGGVLYKDISYEHGPFAPYFNTLLCMIFGLHFHTFIISGVLVTLVFCLFFYKTSRIFLNATFSLLAVITFLAVFAFGQYYYSGIFNFIIPYSYATIYSIIFAIIVLFFYYRFLTKEKNIYQYLCVFFTILSLLSRTEVGGPLIAAIFLGMLLDFKRHGNRKKLFKGFTVFCLIPVFIVSLVYSFFIVISKISSPAANIGFRNLFMRNIEIILINLDLKQSFTGNLFGAIHLQDNVILIFKVVLYYTGISVMFFLGGWVLSLAKKLDFIKRYAIVIGTALFFIGGAVFIQKNYFPYLIQYRCVPIICIALFIIAYRKYSKQGGQPKFLFLAIFSVFSFMLLLRMLFNVWAGHYGFYLLVPGMLCYYIFFLEIIPGIFRKVEARGLYKFGFIVVSVAFILSHTAISFYMYRNSTLEISSHRGSIKTFPVFYRYKQLLDYISNNTDPSDSLIVFPEGLTLNFFSERKHPSYYCSFLPGTFYNPDTEKKIVKDLEDKRVPYIVIIARSTAEFGPGRFGIDYAKDIWRYIVAHYIIEKQFGLMAFYDSRNRRSAFKEKRQ
ncbi:MAG: glycosyltransferase family 39 protein [Candidatus Omnitrophota bacterium]|nr:glycosyltransferase family 39 protein [Candidatus Omnitrophota bacterium]